MKKNYSPAMPLYSVIGSIGLNDISAYVILDKKSNSIHIHYYGKIFGNNYKPILVKHSNSKFPESEGIDLAKQIVISELANSKIQIKQVTEEYEINAEQNKPSQRTIIRFKK